MTAADLVVLGAGPAGLALARASARLGMHVRCLAPSPHAGWERSFGVWACELAELADLAIVEASWASPYVHLGASGRRVLGAGYARLDVIALQDRLLATSVAEGVQIEAGAATAVEHTTNSSRVVLESGRVIDAAVVVDATGGDSPWIARSGARRPAFQSAYGELIEAECHGFDREQMCLMDLRAPSPTPSDTDPPSFLYALPLGNDRLFVEETSLVGRPAVAQSVLEGRLARRLAGAGISSSRVISRERCLIAMGTALPRGDQRTLAFGAAAGLVHPATGYQLARSLALAPQVAAKLAVDGDPAVRVRHAYDVMWPSSRRRAWELFVFGMEALLRLDTDGTGAFFRAFFDLPIETWLAFLRGTLTPAQIFTAMCGVLARGDGQTRRELLRIAPAQRGALARALSWRA